MNKSFLPTVSVLLLFTATTLATTLPDPTRPANYLARASVQEELPGQVAEWRVTAIRISGDSRTAVVNNKLVKAGDNIAGALVLEIKPLAVVLNYEQQNIQVNLIRHDVDKKPSFKKQVTN